MSAQPVHGGAERFRIPDGCEASEPPERRGVPRDAVLLLVAEPDRLRHRRFDAIVDVLDPGDLLVVNTSPTRQAALTGRVDGRAVLVHLATALDDGTWVVEVRHRDGSGPDLSGAPGRRVRLDDGPTLRLLAAHPDAGRRPSRLWRARVLDGADLADHLHRKGQPITYRHVHAPVTLADLQNVYAARPDPTGRVDPRFAGAELASAGRPFSERLLVDLATAGVTVAPLGLHAGVSSPELHEPPAPERYEVPADTARLVNSARAAGRRVVAVGTTVVRALETVAGSDGTVRPGRGWTDLVLGPGRPARAVDGLVTGLHDPQASHLHLLEAVAGEHLVQAAYDAAVAQRYLWHEFGDSMLLLPGPRAGRPARRVSPP